MSKQNSRTPNKGSLLTYERETFSETKFLHACPTEWQTFKSALCNYVPHKLSQKIFFKGTVCLKNIDFGSSGALIFCILFSHLEIVNPRLRSRLKMIC